MFSGNQRGSSIISGGSAGRSSHDQSAEQRQPDPREHARAARGRRRRGRTRARLPHVLGVGRVAGEAQRHVRLDRRRQVGRARRRSSPTSRRRAAASGSSSRPSPVCSAVADAEELAQQQVLGVHGDVRLELALPPALGRPAGRAGRRRPRSSVACDGASRDGGAQNSLSTTKRASSSSSSRAAGSSRRPLERVEQRQVERSRGLLGRVAPGRRSARRAGRPGDRRPRTSSRPRQQRAQLARRVVGTARERERRPAASSCAAAGRSSAGLPVTLRVGPRSRAGRRRPGTRARAGGRTRRARRPRASSPPASTAPIDAAQASSAPVLAAAISTHSSSGRRRVPRTPCRSACPAIIRRSRPRQRRGAPHRRRACSRRAAPVGEGVRARRRR